MWELFLSWGFYVCSRPELCCSSLTNMPMPGCVHPGCINPHRFAFARFDLRLASSRWTHLAISGCCLILATVSRPILTLTRKLNFLGWLQAWFITRDLFDYLDSCWTWLPSPELSRLPCWDTVGLGTSLWCNCLRIPWCHPGSYLHLLFPDSCNCSLPWPKEGRSWRRCCQVHHWCLQGKCKRQQTQAVGNSHWIQGKFHNQSWRFNKTLLDKTLNQLV